MWTSAQFDERAEARDITLSIGPHLIYELGRGFVSGRDTSEVRSACGFLAEIQQIEFLPTLEASIAAEFDQATLAVPIITVLDPINQAAARLALAQLARGDAKEAATFIARREVSIRVVSPEITQLNSARLRALRKVRTFDEFR